MVKACTGHSLPLQQMLFFDALEALPWPLPSPFEESANKDKKKVRTLHTQRENDSMTLDMDEVGGDDWRRWKARDGLRCLVSVWRWVLWTEEEGGQGASAGGGRGRRTAHRGRLQVRPLNIGLQRKREIRGLLHRPRRYA